MATSALCMSLRTEDMLLLLLLLLLLLQIDETIIANSSPFCDESNATTTRVSLSTRTMANPSVKMFKVVTNAAAAAAAEDDRADTSGDTKNSADNNKSTSKSLLLPKHSIKSHEDLLLEASTRAAHSCQTECCRDDALEPLRQRSVDWAALVTDGGKQLLLLCS